MCEGAVLRLRPRERPEAVDVAARAYFSEPELDRARRFRAGQRRLGWMRSAIQLTALGVLVRRPPAVLLAAGAPVRTGAAAAVGLAAGLSALDLPLRAASRERARRVGLITQGWRGWGGDVVKGLAIESALAAGAGALGVAGLRRFGRGWWLPGAGAAVAFGALTTTLAPLLLDPIFNRFEPLAEGPVRRDVLALAERAGVRVGEVYEVDASRRTTAVNAYVTGLGPTKRVVLFDTLLRDFPGAEVNLVVAHELGHVRFRDVARGFGLLAAIAPAGLLAVAIVGERLAPAGAAHGPAALPGLALSGALLGPLVSAIGSQLSRAIEVRADAFALELTGDPETLIAFERRVTLKNVMDPHPPAWERLLSSHPSTMERIGLALAAGRGA
ncbi:MAG: endopeptidase [Solirubrobacteraceae bacterium]|nr:endopeptidase [Solirubrobacteraceae bacterium]